MKKFLLFILVMLTIGFQSIAQESNGNSDRHGIILVTHSQQQTSTPMRAPMRINIDAFYDSESSTINICYDGETIGEVFLYLNGTVIGYDSEINTSFPIYTPGFYKIEIIGKNWIAEGDIQL